MWGKKVKTEDNDSGMCGERRLKQRTMIQKLYMHCVHTLYMHNIQSCIRAVGDGQATRAIARPLLKVWGCGTQL